MKSHTKVGLTFLAGIVLLYILIAWTKHLHLFSVNSQPYFISFSDVAGLKKGDPVSVYGHPVGNVQSITLTDSVARVHIMIDRQVVLKKDAYAEIRMKELMGSKSVELIPGRSTMSIRPGASIPGVTAMDISSAIASLGRLVSKVNPDDLSSLLDNLRVTAEGFAVLANEMKRNEIGNLFSGMNRSVTHLNELLYQLNSSGMVEKVNVSLDNFNGLTQELDGSLENIDRISSHLLDKSLPATDSLFLKTDQFLEEGTQVVSTLNDLMEELRSGKGMAGKLIYDEQFARELEGVLNNFNVTLDHIRNKKLHVAMSFSHKQKKKFEEGE